MVGGIGVLLAVQQRSVSPVLCMLPCCTSRQSVLLFIASCSLWLHPLRRSCQVGRVFAARCGRFGARLPLRPLDLPFLPLFSAFILTPSLRLASLYMHDHCAESDRYLSLSHTSPLARMYDPPLFLSCLEAPALFVCPLQTPRGALRWRRVYRNTCCFFVSGTPYTAHPAGVLPLPVFTSASVAMLPALHVQYVADVGPQARKCWCNV